MIKKYIAILLICMFSSVVNAGLITYSDTQLQTVAGQDFVFNFSPVVSSDGGEGLLELLIRGDFTIGASLGESFGFDLESVITGTGLQATAGNVITSFNANDNLFKITQIISASDLSSILGDSSINLNVDFASGVNLNLSTAFITASIQYNDNTTSVPEPAALALVGFALVGLGAMRRKKAS